MKEKLLKSTSLVSFMTFISRIFGFVRDMVIATLFGAGAGVDAFLVAFKIPNFMRRLFAEGAFSQAFVPVLSEYESKGDDKATKALCDATFGCLSFVLFWVTCLGILVSPWIIMLFAPGFDHNGPRFEMATQMLRWTFPYLFFISLTAFLGAIQNVKHRFAVPAFTPVLLNVSLIFAALYLSKFMPVPVNALAIGVLIAGGVQFFFQFPFLARMGCVPRPRLQWQHAGVRRILRLMGPAIIGASVMQINLLVDTLFASFLPVGSLTWLYYSDRLLEFPMGIFGVALATVTLPHLAKKHAEQNTQGFNASMDWSFRWIALIGIPSSLGLIILAGPILATLFQYGQFGANDVLMARLSLMALSTGLVAFLAVKVLVSAFFAQQDTRFPMRVAFVALIANVILNALLISPLQHAGLALASALSGMLQLVVLYRALIKRQMYRPLPGWASFLLRLLLANLVMVLVLQGVFPDMHAWLGWGAFTRAMNLGLAFGMAILSYLFVLFLTGLKLTHLQLQES